MASERKESEVEAVARGQWWAITTAQIRALGCAEYEIRGMVARGQLHRLHRGVFAYGRRELPVNGVLLAAQLACGTSAYLTRHTALAIHKLRGQYLGRIDVAVPVSAVRAKRPPIHLHATDAVPSHELRSNGPLRYASIPRALLELAPHATIKELSRHITKAIQRGTLEHADMVRLLDEHARRPGIGTLAAAYGAYLPEKTSRSGAERAFDALLATRPWIPEPEHNVVLDIGGRKCEIDRLWRDYNLAAEIDGGQYHSAKEDVENDHEKTAKLLSIGISTFRASDARIELAPEQVLDDLEASLAGMGWRKAA